MSKVSPVVYCDQSQNCSFFSYAKSFGLPNRMCPTFLPGPIASVFWLDDELESRLQLDGIVTLVDSYHILSQLTETTEASQQIAYADRILVNKTDLVESTEDILASIRAINPTAQIQSTVYSQVPDLDWILDAKCYDKSHKTDAITHEVQELVSKLNHDDHGHEHHEHQKDCSYCVEHTTINESHVHTDAVSTVALKAQGSMDWGRLNRWLASTLWPNQDEKDKVLRAQLEKHLQEGDTPKTDNNEKDEENLHRQQIYRMKGILSVRHDKETIEDEKWLSYCDFETGIDKRQFIVQAVYDLWEVYPSSENYKESADRDNKLVIIGRNLKRDELEKGFFACLIQ